MKSTILVSIISFLIVLLPLLSAENVVFEFPSPSSPQPHSSRGLLPQGGRHRPHQGAQRPLLQLRLPHLRLPHHVLRPRNQLHCLLLHPVDNVNPASFISTSNQTLGSVGGFLGLVNSSEGGKNKFVAVEFDTKMDLEFNDPDENHVGLDVDSLIWIKTANPMLWGIDLKSGNLINAWIDYKNEHKKLEVFLSYSSFKPESPLLMVDVDLSGYLKEQMFVGFSASTEGSTELHYVENWSFETVGFRHVSPTIPHNVSDSTVTSKALIAVSKSGNRPHKKLGLGIGMSGPLFFGLALLLFCVIAVALPPSQASHAPVASRLHLELSNQSTVDFIELALFFGPWIDAPPRDIHGILSNLPKILKDYRVAIRRALQIQRREELGDTVVARTLFYFANLIVQSSPAEEAKIDVEILYVTFICFKVAALEVESKEIDASKYTLDNSRFRNVERITKTQMKALVAIRPYEG